MSNWELFAAGSRKRSSNFAETCNRLSQYIKEKRCLKDVNLEIARNLQASGKPEASCLTTAPTMDLLNIMGKSDQTLTQRSPSIDLLPQYADDSFPYIFEDDINKPSSSKSTTANESKASQMTIFYAGQVMVFDDLTVDIAKEVFQLATKGTDKTLVGGSVDLTVDIAKEVFQLATKGTDKTQVGGSVAPASDAAPNSGSENFHEHLQSQSPPQPESNTSDLPIARRTSLHRFLAKRKDRGVARAPYQLQNPSASSSSKHVEELDLNL